MAITSLVINTLWDRHTHKHTYRCPHRNNLRNQACAGLHVPGLKMLLFYYSLLYPIETVSLAKATDKTPGEEESSKSKVYSGHHFFTC